MSAQGTKNKRLWIRSTKTHKTGRGRMRLDENHQIGWKRAKNERNMERWLYCQVRLDLCGAPSSEDPQTFSAKDSDSGVLRNNLLLGIRIFPVTNRYSQGANTDLYYFWLHGKGKRWTFWSFQYMLYLTVGRYECVHPHTMSESLSRYSFHFFRRRRYFRAFEVDED